MGFYGHIIKDPGQTQFYFDRKYSNLAELKRHETTDGIYAGRYVLVEYSEDFKFKGIALQNSNIIKEDDGSLYGKADGLLEGDFVSITIDKNTAVYKCISFTNKGIAVFDTTPAIQGEKINYYDFNYNVDRVYLQESFGRGYDSTVWQKVFIDDDEIVEKYVMIAELNSVTPTFNIITDAPTNETKQIEVRGDSTNLNYNIVMPAVWGFDFPKAITYNKDGFAKEITSYDDNNDTFKIEDISKNNIQYPLGQSNGEAKADTKQLTINLPSIGNAISNVWDIVYGESLKQGEKRPLIPVKLDSTKVGDVSKIYVDNDGVLYRAVGETYVELPADDNIGSLKALQLKMHHYLGTGEDSPSNNTIPGAINQIKNSFTDLVGSNSDTGFDTIYGSLNSLEQYLGNENSNADFTTMHGAVKTLKNLAGSDNDTGFDTIHGSLNSLEQYFGTENSNADFTTMHGAVKTLKNLAGTDGSDNTDTLHGLKNAVTTLMGKSEDVNFDTMYGVRNSLTNAIAKGSNSCDYDTVYGTINSVKALVGDTSVDELTYGTVTSSIAKANELIGKSDDKSTDTIEGAINVVNDLIGEKPADEDLNITTIYGALKVFNDLSKDEFSADLLVSGDKNTVLTHEEKNKLFNKDGNNIVYDEISKLETKILGGEELKDTFDTLVEIQQWIEGDGVNTTGLTGAIANEAEARRIKDIDLQQQLDNLTILNGSVAKARSAEAASSLDATGITQVQGIKVNNATTADKVANNLSIQLNGGSASTYNGSAGLSISINPNAIGAAAKEHGNHVPTIETANNTRFLRCDNTWAKVDAANIGAAPTSHNHSASEITSGTLAVARGGTGVASNPSMLTNLSSTTAASVFAGNPRPGITGTLPIANGGTGATTAAAARTNLGIPKIGSGPSLPTGTELDNYAEGDIFFLIKE